MKGMLLCHTRKCAHRSFHVSVSSSRVSAFWQTFHFGSKQIQYDESISACALLRKYSSSVLLCFGEFYYYRCRIMLSSEDSVWGPSEELQDKAKAESDMLLWHAAKWIRIAWIIYICLPRFCEIPISTPFGSKATEEDEGHGGGGGYWSEVGCAFWSQLTWGFWQFSRWCFPLRFFF